MDFFVKNIKVFDWARGSYLKKPKLIHFWADVLGYRIFIGRIIKVYNETGSNCKTALCQASKAYLSIRNYFLRYVNNLVKDSR